MFDAAPGVRRSWFPPVVLAADLLCLRQESWRGQTSSTVSDRCARARTVVPARKSAADALWSRLDRFWSPCLSGVLFVLPSAGEWTSGEQTNFEDQAELCTTMTGLGWHLETE